MRFLMVCLMGLMLSVQANTAQQSTVSVQMRLADGRPVAGAQVTLFDLAHLQRGAVARAMTDESGYFALPLASLGGSALPQGFALGHNYPNPFNPSTVIPYQLPTATHVRLDVFNVLGQHMATLVDEERPAGFHVAQWDATDVAGQAVGAGVYFYRLRGAGGELTRRMVLVDGQAGVAAAVPSASATMLTEAAEREYGLVVSGEGLTTYTDAAFAVRAGMAPIELVVDAAPLTTGKVLAGEILGDVTNDGQVGLEDAMLVAIYRSNPSIGMPNNGRILLGDVNGDRAVNETDVLAIMRYISNPSDGALPAGIGQRIARGKPVADGRNLTNSEAEDYQPAWSSDGRIAFSSNRDGNLNRDGNFEIYVMDTDGLGAPERLTDHQATDNQPAWSSDGRQIAFSSNRDGNFEIYVMDTDGSNLQRLTNHSARDESPAWSPDGRQIAFLSDRDGNLEIHAMAADGSDVRNITNSEAVNYHPAWSPDGRQIAFERNFEIYVMAADGSDVYNLTKHGDKDRSPVWSSDGRIAFSSNRDGNFEIHAMAADGSDVRNLTKHSSWDHGILTWSPDGRQIAFSSNRDGNLEIYVMNVDGMEIDSEPMFAGPVSDQTFTEGVAMSPLELPFASGGDGALTYSLSSAVPGLTFDAASRTLSGTPTAADVYTLTYRVEDSDGDTDTEPFTVTVAVPDSEPMFAGPVSPQTVTAGKAMTPLELPVASGGDDELIYSLSPAVLGLTFDAASRTLSGTPTVAGTYVLTYQVKDSDGDADTETFTVTVDSADTVTVPDSEPMFAGPVSPQTVTAGEAMTPLELPMASGGDGALTYSLSSAVPGLTFDAASRTLSGTPTAAGTYALTYRVEDSDGDTDTEPFTVTVTSKIDIEPPSSVSFELPGGVSMEFVWISAGTFQMGSPDTEEGRYPDEGPVHEVKISEGFYLGKYEITQSQWKAVMGSNPSSYKDEEGDRPVERVTWHEVQEFIRRLSEFEGKESYRLPTEAEWEYACRAGTQTPWSFGDNESQLTQYAWYRSNNNPDGTKAVGSKKPNPWGLHDMHGNVWEWVQDWYDEEYYNSRSDWVDPQGPTSGSARVRRGGHFSHAHVGVRSAYRHLYLPENRSFIIGARLLRIR